MFVITYFKALFAGQPKEALDAGKVLSDLVGMLNRGTWMFAFGQLIRAAERHIVVPTWWETLALQTAAWSFGGIIPILLVGQVFLIGTKSLRAIEDPAQQRVWVAIYVAFYTILIVVAFVSIVAIVTTSYGLRDVPYLRYVIALPPL
ncbi:hypothetical protein [Rhizobium leguminosarum]|uniref:Integral membrane protein n=1 Tax=Rhizobium leguminosarum TaxID=384 RepID=A0ABD7PIA5_RHILE|nr:hypothetical protein [Rhizobium leguminosarum]TAV62527.1 hypothetical protein ELI28_32860 [Rhizobium leguminosarum]TAV65927.1 hypothetical protein ELI27_26920 [Rhizobium leguminosarum]TAW19693.1 hypothetical protein ELI19_31360 [Rhizobium leguminosarum]TAW32640.1 hypothetical protein ELI18_32040 [Rhizobium leguminosarum]TAZ26327.1 hypothetical protein ELH73_26820 [Rhizobium leguminosarum]